MENNELIIRKYTTRIQKEYERARRVYPPFNSFGYGDFVLRKQYDQFWQEITKSNGKIENIEKQLIEIGAMALGILVDVVANYHEDEKEKVTE